MKKIVIGMLAMAFVVFTANAQETRKMKPRQQGNERGMMMKELNLTTEQKAQMQANRENVKMQMAELKKNDKITVKEYNERKAAIMKTQKEQMDKVLTAEQKNQLAQQKGKHKGMKGMKQGMKQGNRMGQPDMNRMKADLNLTEAQVSQLKAHREANMGKMKAIRENSQLSDTQKKEQLKALKAAQQNSLTQVLTPEQLNKMELQRKNRQDKPHRK